MYIQFPLDWLCRSHIMQYGTVVATVSWSNFEGTSSCRVPLSVNPSICILQKLAHKNNIPCRQASQPQDPLASLPT